MKRRDGWGSVARFMWKARLVGGSLLLIILAATVKYSITSEAAAKKPTAIDSTKSRSLNEHSRLPEAFGKLPLSFEENQGQTAPEVRYVSHGSGYEFFLTPQEVVLALRPNHHYDLSPVHRTSSLRAMREPQAAEPMTVVRMQMVGANPNPDIAGLERQTAKVNYFFGNDPKKWRTNVSSFGRVKYTGVYPGVDMVFYGNQRRLEYDFVVAPGADPHAIKMKIDGAQKMRVNAHGDLVLSVASGEVALQKPVIYQDVRGKRLEIAGTYVMDGFDRVTFSVPSYDRSAPLILDPVLDYATYLGGTADDSASAIAVDGSGDMFIAGQTLSVDFPSGTNGAVIPAPSPNLGASFVAELDPTGANLLYSTYLAGSPSTSGDAALGLAVDSSGKVYVVGVTFAINFPTTTANAFKAGPLTTNTNGTAYLTKLDPTASGTSSLIYSTYIGGTGGEVANSVAVDAAGNAYVVGQTFSSGPPSTTGFPTTANALQSAPSNASGTAFLTRIDTTKAGPASLIFSTYFGGNGANAANTAGLGYGDEAWGVAVDSSQNAYLVGGTTSTDSPASFITSATARQTAPHAGNTQGSAFVSVINTTTGSLVYSTYLSGSTQDVGFAIGLGPGNVAYVTGSTSSTDFLIAPNPGAFDTTGTAAGKAFVTLVDATKSGLASVPYSTYLGGTGGNNGFAIKVDASGNAYVGGTTASSDFPVTSGAFQSSLLNTNGNAFIAKLNPIGGGASDLLYATYYGGSGNGTLADQGNGLAIDSASPPNVYIAGQTISSNLPVLTTLPKGGSLQGPSDAFVAKLTLIPTLAVAPTPYDFGVQQIGVTSAAHSFVLTNNTSSAVNFGSIVVTGVSPASNSDFAISSDGCSPSLPAGTPTCTVNVTFKPSVAGAESATLTFNASVSNGGRSGPNVITVNLSGTGSSAAPGVGLDHSTVAFGGQPLTTTSAAIPVKLTNTGTGALTINSIAASGDFAQTNNCPVSPATLAAGGTCTINITFTPTAVGARSGTLTVTDNASGSPQTVALTGTGTAPGVGFDHTSVAFSGQLLTTTSASSPVKLSNTGTGALTINSIAASGDFAQTNNCPVSPATLTTGGTCTINITFAPTVTGARSGTLTVTDNASGSPQTVALTGTGWDFQVASPASSPSGSSPLTFNETMTPLGGFNQSVAFICTGAPAGTSCTIATPITAADGTTPQPVAVTVTRTSTALLVPITLPGNMQLMIRGGAYLIVVSMLCLLLVKGRRIHPRLGFVTAMILFVILAGCSGTNKPAPTPITGTLTITGTAGTVSHSTTVTVTVK